MKIRIRYIAAGAVVVGLVVHSVPQTVSYAKSLTQQPSALVSESASAAPGDHGMHPLPMPWHDCDESPVCWTLGNQEVPHTHPEDDVVLVGLSEEDMVQIQAALREATAMQ